MGNLKFAFGGSWHTLAPTTHVWDINSGTSGYLNVNRIAGYPNVGTSYLNGAGTWSSPAIIISGAVTGSGSLSSSVYTSLGNDQDMIGVLSFNWSFGTPDFKIRNLSGGTTAKFSIGSTSYNWLFDVQSSGAAPSVALKFVIQAGGLGGRLTDTPFYVAQDSSDSTRFVVATDANMAWGYSGDQYIYYGRNASTIKLMQKTLQVGTNMFRNDFLRYDNYGFSMFYSSSSGYEEFGWGKVSTSGVLTKTLYHSNSSAALIVSSNSNFYGHIDASSYDISTSGTISAKTGTIRANNYDTYSATNINMVRTTEWMVSGAGTCYINPSTITRAYSNSGFYNSTASTLFETKAGGETCGIIMNGDYMQFYNPLDTLGFIFSDEDAALTSYVCYINGSGVLVSSSGNTKYSIRKKKEKDYLDRIKKLDICSYGRIIDDNENDSEEKKIRKDRKRRTLHVGLIAENVREVFDNATNITKFLDIDGTGEEKTEEPDSLAINYNVMLCYAILALKELDKKVEDLKGDLNGR